jgi:hypothetical protein
VVVVEVVEVVELVVVDEVVVDDVVVEAVVDVVGRVVVVVDDVELDVLVDVTVVFGVESSSDARTAKMINTTATATIKTASAQ